MGPAVPEDTVELCAAREPSPPWPLCGHGARPPAAASDRQALASLVAPALERQAPRARLHTRAKAVGTGALALLWLVSTFHAQRVPKQGGTTEYTQAVGLSRRLRVRGSERPAESPGAFSRALRQRPAEPRKRLRSPLVYSPTPAAISPGALTNSFVERSGRSRLSLPAQPDAVPAWRAIRAELQRLVGDSAYEIWLAPIELDAFDGDVLMLRAPQATEKWLAGRFGPVLERCVRQILGTHTRVAFAGAPAPHHEPQPGRFGPNGAPTELNPRYRFEQFIIGEGNRLAHAAALAVAELPGQAYNPLFLYAPPGLGKTHLLHAIGNYVLDYGGGATVRYTTAEAFTNHFISALSTKSIDAFKHAYRDADVLLIDDVQFLASKARTEEEFFHTFNALYENGRQLVLTCDRLPRALIAIEQRLRERFEAGLVADIKPAGPRHARGHPAQARRARQHRARRTRRARPHRRPRHRQHPRARGRADPRRRLPLAHPATDRPGPHPRGAGRHVSRSPALRPPVDRRGPGDRRRPLQALGASSSPRPAASAPSRGPARWPSISPAISPAPPCRPSARPSAGATTPPCSTPASGSPSGSRTINKLLMRSPACQLSSPRIKPTATVDRLACPPSTAISSLFAGDRALLHSFSSPYDF